MRVAGKSWSFVCLLALALAAPAAMAQSGIKRLVVFGDSLSDPGNAFALAGGTSTPPDFSLDPFLIPSQPYVGGGSGSHHFSNGPTWIEQLGRALGLAQSTRPAFRDASAGASNYAIGGARARNVDSTSLGQQVLAFLNDNKQAPADALYVIAIGGNDLRDALDAALHGQAPDPIIAGAVAAVGASMQQLAAAGAQRFLVWRVPNIGLTPAIKGLGAINPAIPLFADLLTQGYNKNLEDNVLAPFEGFGFSITRLDVYTFLNGVVTPGGAAAAGFTNVTTACITPNVAPFQCKNADEYLFWDGIHPTTAGHALIAQQAAALLGTH